jgi:hypothetical protein
MCLVINYWGLVLGGGCLCWLKFWLGEGWVDLE